MSSWLAFNAAFDGPKFVFVLPVCPAAAWALLKITSLVSQPNCLGLPLPLPQLLLLLLNNASVLSVRVPPACALCALIVCPGVAGIKCIKTPISGQRLAGSNGICMAAKCPTGN